MKKGLLLVTLLALGVFLASPTHAYYTVGSQLGVSRSPRQATYTVYSPYAYAAPATSFASPYSYFYPFYTWNNATIPYAGTYYPLNTYFPYYSYYPY